MGAIEPNDHGPNYSDKKYLSRLPGEGALNARQRCQFGSSPGPPAKFAADLVRRLLETALLRGLSKLKPTLCKRRFEEPDGTGAYAVEGEQFLA